MNYLRISLVFVLIITINASPNKEIKSKPNSLENDFLIANGPAPYILWQWMNGCVTKEGITYDLESFKKVGISNVQQFLVGGIEADVTDSTVTILGNKWNDLMRFSLDECQRLGIDFGTHNCPGWSASAAPGIKAENSMQKLIWAKTIVSGKTSKETPIARGKVDSIWNYYRDICLLAIPQNRKVISKDSIIFIINGLDHNNNLKKDLPEGDWDVLRFGHTTIGKINGTAPVSGQGLEVDKLDRKSLEKFWALYPEKLIALAGEHAGKTFKRLEMDSYEAGMQDWTSDMANEFKNRRGYELFPWLAAIAGYTVESKDATSRFKYDWQHTINDLFTDNYFKYFEELMHRVPGMEFVFEPYGTGGKNFDETSIRGIGDMLMCEFWMRPSTWGWETLFQVSSNAHVNGKKIIAAEAFTGQPQYAFQSDLADLKLTGDEAFCGGVNLFTLHAAAHQPWPQVKPGMTMGWWGTQFGPSQTWWGHGAAEWIQYVKRCQLLLQKGLFVGDLCYLQLYQNQQRDTIVPKGYKADVCNKKELISRFTVKENRLCLSDGMSYRVLVLPNQPRIESEIALKIEELVNNGAIIVGNGFAGSPGLENYPQTNAEVLAISERLFGANDSKHKIQKDVRKIGKGKVYCGYSPEEALILENISKDLEVLKNEKDLLWIHRKNGDEHYYFISNQSSQNKSCSISFRVSDMKPEIWDPVTGKIKNAEIWGADENKTTVNLNLEARGSCFVVFRYHTKKRDGNIKSFSFNEQNLNTATCLIQNNGKTLLKLRLPGIYTLTLQNNETLTKRLRSTSDSMLLIENWEVRFEKNRGAPASARFDRLISWPEHSEAGIKYFSGTAHYAKPFILKPDQLKPYKRIILNLGKVRNVAEISVNKRKVAVLWQSPFEIDITDYCKKGENVLDVDVTNLWPNRMIGDKTEPDDCVWGPIRSFGFVKPVPTIGRNLKIVPDWVKNKIQRPSKNRVTFCTMDFFTKDTRLLPSGLIGPVQLKIEDIWDITNYISN